ncbi:MAG: DUF169 domain-containing protein [Dehalococcoidia bacterium]|nr:DUF169 domain-containing protein [Dehalococcoidia bacterium]
MEPVERIRKALGIKAEAVGVKYTDEVSTPKPAQGKYTVCTGILEAAEGKVVMLSKETCPCPGGQVHLGLTEAKAIPLKFLVEGEKLWCDVKTATRSRIEWLKIAPPPLGIAGKVYLYPASMDVFVPDLVLFLVNAEQVSRLITLAQFWDGKTPSFEMRGAMCWSAITYPLVSGNFNITVGDISGRRIAGWNENIMIATVPVEKVQGIADAIDKSTAGTARPSEDFEKIIASIKAMRNK